MNSLLRMQQPQQLNLSQISSLLKTLQGQMTPQQAQQQVNQLIKERGISDAEFDNIKQQATQICKQLGLS